MRAPADPGEVQRVGRVLAIARAVLALCALAAVRVDPTEPSRFQGVINLALLGYMAFSLLMLAAWFTRREPGNWFSWCVHGVDIVWAAAITTFSGGPNSPFFLFFLFAMVAAAYRWALRETLLTAGAVLLFLFVEALVLVSSWGRVLLEGEFELNRFIMRSVYVLLFGFIFGYLAEEEKQLKAESSFAIRVMAQAGAATGMSRALRGVFDQLLRLFGCERLLVAIAENESERGFLWQARRPAQTGDAELQLTELEVAGRAVYLEEDGAASYYAVRDRRGFRVLALDYDGRRLRGSSGARPGEAGGAISLAAVHSFQSVLVCSFPFGQEWRGRLFVLDPAVSRPVTAELRFLQTLARQLVPALQNIYLVRRLRARAGAIERARVARELHDGTIQSLTAMEMQVDVLRRCTEPALPGPAAAELARIQHMLREEVLNLRELMEQLKPIELTAPQLSTFLADSVQKFRRETGIAAEFVCLSQTLDLAPRCCGELARIVQEALVNVRKHAGARHVTVRLNGADGACRLIIEDDGAGFDFSGRLSHEELEASHRGPSIIKQRVRAIDGRLCIESAPGRGARLEIFVPMRSHA